MEIKDIRGETLAALMASPASLSSRELYERSRLAADRKAISNILYRLKQDGLVQMILLQGGGSVYSLTSAGIDEVHRLGLASDGELTPVCSVEEKPPIFAGITDASDPEQKPEVPRQAEAEPQAPEPVTAEQMDQAVAELDASNARENGAAAAADTDHEPIFGFFSDGTLEIINDAEHISLSGRHARALIDWLVSIKPAVDRALGYRREAQS